MHLAVICVQSDSEIKYTFVAFFLFVFLQKRRDRAAEAISNGDTASRPEVSSATEDISVPKDLDLIALPQLCFPGIVCFICDITLTCFELNNFVVLLR